jgi:hypothetical protein
MPTTTYTPLANLTLSSSASTVTFSNIPATYRDLVLVIDDARSATSQQFNVRLNGDTGTNYSWVTGFVIGSDIIGSAQGAPLAQFRLGNINTTSSSHITNIMDYSATDKHKTSLTRSTNVGGNQVWMLANRYASTSAITSVSIYTGGDPMLSGMTASLYGIVA